MTIDEVHQELRNCWSDWEGFLANINFIQRSGIICWPNYRPTIFQNVSWEDVEALATDRQYSFQLHDGSIIQLVYDFRHENRSIQKASLSYFQALPEFLDAEDDAGMEAQGPEDNFIVESYTAPRWIRLDYEINQASSCIHSECHLHLSGFPDTRIIVSGVPGPRQFLEAIFAWFYPQLYSDIKLASDTETRSARIIEVNRICVPLTPSDTFHPVFFLSLPPSVRHDRLPARS